MSRNFDQPLGVDHHQQQHHHPHEQHPSAQAHQRYKFTSDELRVIKECNRESFWQRSMPMMTLLSAGVYAGIKRGILQPSPRWGAAPKMSLAIGVGYFLGKLSYQRKCVEKIMQLPDSPLADMLRKQTGRGIISETMDPFYSASTTSEFPASPSSEPVINMDVMDVRPISSFDTESSNFVGFDARSEKIDTTDQMLDDDNLPPKPPQVYQSYEDLRRQNRIDYEMQRHPPSASSATKPPVYNDSGNRYTPARDTAAPPPPTKRKNIYGDVWEDVPNGK